MAGELTTLEELNTQIKDALDNKLTPSADIIKQFAQTVGTITLDSGEILKTLKYWQDENQASFDEFLDELKNNATDSYQWLLEMRTLRTQTQEASNLALGTVNYQGVFVAGSTSAVAGASYAYQNEIWLCLVDTSDAPARGNASWKNGFDELSAVASQLNVKRDKVAFLQTGVSLSATVLRDPTNELTLIAWDELVTPYVITSVTENEFTGYDVVTDQGTFEFVMPEISSNRKKWMADSFGDTLNNAVERINRMSLSNRIKLNVPDGMSIDGIIRPNFDCDFEAGYVQTISDFPILFQPEPDWSGSWSDCIIECNQNSHGRIFDFYTNNFSEVKLGRMLIKNQGDQNNGTSSSRFVGYYIKNNGSGKIEIESAGCEDIYVSPDGTIGNSTGSNRCVIIQGDCISGYSPTHIDIKEYYAKNLLTEEDSDGLLLEATCSDNSNDSLTLDVHIGRMRCMNVQKRGMKLQTDNSNIIEVDGIYWDASGDSFFSGDSSTKPVSALSVYSGMKISIRGTLGISGRSTYGLDINGGMVSGDLNLEIDLDDSQTIDGNTTRTIFCRSYTDANSKIWKGGFSLGSIKGKGNFELIRLDDAETFGNVFGGIDYQNIGSFGLLAGDFTFSSDIKFKSTSTNDFSNDNGTLRSTANIISKNGSELYIDLTECTNPPRSGVRCVGSEKVVLGKMETVGVSTATIELSSVESAELYSPINLTSSHAVRLEGANGVVDINWGRNPNAITYQPSGTTTSLNSINERIY